MLKTSGLLVGKPHQPVIHQPISFVGVNNGRVLFRLRRANSGCAGCQRNHKLQILHFQTNGGSEAGGEGDCTKREALPRELQEASALRLEQSCCTTVARAAPPSQLVGLGR